MKTIKINYNNGDHTITKINGTLEEVARHYFGTSWGGKEVISIEILEAGNWIFENEYFVNTPLKIYLEDSEIIKEFDLQYNIRKEYKTEYKGEYKQEYKDFTTSCGFMNIQRCNYC